jgi:hypothetical protein
LSVCTVVVSDGGHDPEAAIAGIESQTVAQDELLLTDELHDAVRLGCGQYLDWIWAVDASVVPEPAALERLLAPLDHLGSLPTPALLAGRILTPAGELDPDSLPFAETRDPELLVTGFERKLLGVRVARRGSLLIRRSAVERCGPPRARRRLLRDDLEWTARLLRDEVGVLVPASVAVRRPGTAHGKVPALRELASLLELILGDALRLREKPWYTVRLVDAALAAAGLSRARF